jgi:hypothetical protein
MATRGMGENRAPVQCVCVCVCVYVCARVDASHKAQAHDHPRKPLEGLNRCLSSSSAAAAGLLLSCVS